MILFAQGCLLQAQGKQTSSEKTVNNGFILFAPLFSKNTYLIDKSGKAFHVWKSRYNPGQSVYLLQDGTLLRTGNDSSAFFYGGGGVIQKLDWNSRILWQYSISDSLKRHHHDICPLPNGNILVLVWEKISRGKAIFSGRDSTKTGKCVWSEKIMEIKPLGKDSAKLVWEWSIWDHLVQDLFPNAKNYGDVRANPGRLDANYKAFVTEDWLHFNSLDYNAVLDQIMISNRNLNEIYIIDHSTSIAEAKGSTGGKWGRGGDLLYRWGNPEAYRRGSAGEQQLFRQHHAHWIKAGLPGAGKIMLFNNGLERGGENEYSSVIIIDPPKNEKGYLLERELAFGPVSPEWVYEDRQTFFSRNVSSAQRLPNGNTLICEGAQGRFFEIDVNKQTVWQFVNPVSGNGRQADEKDKNTVFRCVYYEKNYSGFNGKRLTKAIPMQ